MNDRKYSVPEVARLMGTTTKHVYRLVEERRIAFVRVGGKLRFLESDLEAYLAANRVEARAS
ncbi:MAG TPA: helix-turn-helix domain-containing protein [Acidimicrobiales bacterium]|nr:helix-turn-helix domain-containing protein [Acidimicrobiales bacterium]